MMTQQFFNSLIMWQQDSRYERTIELRFGGPSRKNEERVWVYDYDLMSGAIIGSEAELETLDLCSRKKDKLIQELNKMN